MNKPCPTFYEYCNASNKYNLHPELESMITQHSNINQLDNLIFYGPPGSGKYTQALRYIQKYSSTQLKHEKKITINVACKSKIIPFILKMSDIHFEINMAFIECYSKILWDEIYKQIMEIVSSRNTPSIIICRDFQSITPDLLSIFYNYMRNCGKPMPLKFIFLTTALSFMPNSIVESCNLIRVKQPSIEQYSKLSIKNPVCCPHQFICDNIIDKMDSGGKKHIEFRDAMYEIFTCCLNIYDCVAYIIFNMIKNGAITNANVNETSRNILLFLQQYDNNYHPIFHLERFLCQQVLLIDEG
jgi:hypothetical protein